MLFSYKELKRLANLPTQTTVEEVVTAINSIGFEVEGTTNTPNIEGIKFGKITKIYKNPNADKLNVCEIKFNDKDRVIQTNADNVFEGMIVIGFVPGAKVGDMTFDAKELQGVVSEGMLTSLNEFGFDKDLLRDGATDGIQGYGDVDLDVDPIEFLGLNDTIIDIDILSNRSDAQSYIIMANELAAYFNTKMIEINVNEPSLNSDLTIQEGNQKSLSLIEAKTNFEITWKERLLLVKTGIKTINDVIDLTNLTLIMTGQPTHAYDKSKVGQSFTAKLTNGKVNLLGNNEVDLDNDLAIISDDKIVSIAGSMGLENTSVSNDTKDIVLELGIFNIKEVRKTMKNLKLNSNSGIQSSKIISDGTTSLAIKYLSSKLNSFSEVVGNNSTNEKTIDYSSIALSRVAGFNIVEDGKYAEVISALETLGFKFTSNTVTIPSYRHDVNTQQDINEEIFRFYGYNNLPLIAPKVSPYKVTSLVDEKTKIAGMGYDEVVLYTLTSLENNLYNPFGFKNEIKLTTFVSKEREVVRNSQITPMLEILEYNIKRNLMNLDFFSKGMINDGINSIALATNTKDFTDIKQDVVNLLPEGIEFIPTKDETLHPGVSADIILGGKKIGFIGKVNPKLSNIDAWIAEFIITDSIKEVKYQQYETDPIKTRDVTYELANKETVNTKLDGIDYIEAKVIDVFEKDDIRKVTVRYYLNKTQLENFDK